MEWLLEMFRSTLMEPHLPLLRTSLRPRPFRLHGSPRRLPHIRSEITALPDATHGLRPSTCQRTRPPGTRSKP